MSEFKWGTRRIDVTTKYWHHVVKVYSALRKAGRERKRYPERERRRRAEG